LNLIFPDHLASTIVLTGPEMPSALGLASIRLTTRRGSSVTWSMRWRRSIVSKIGGQLILNPANNRDDDVVGVLEMRLVFDF
jgi:hypothetical protein